MFRTKGKPVSGNARLCERASALGFILTFLILLSVACHAESAASARSGIVDANSTIGSQFAIGDFDGDVRPDFASIETVVNFSGNTNYWIKLQLSAAGRQSISLVAPPGGLIIQARDVNGDHAMDLVLATAWLKQPVAILLNDGHGNFSRVEPSKFPEAFNSPETNWSSTAGRDADFFGLPSQPRSAILRESEMFRGGRLATTRIGGRTTSFFNSLFLASLAGRAPPPHDLFL